MALNGDDKVALKRNQALELLHGQRWSRRSAAELEARGLLPELRKLRQFDLLAQLSERVARLHPDEPLIRRMQTQALIETGLATAAIDVARAGLKGLPEDHPEWSELTGLIGRAYKQIVLDAKDPGDSESLVALGQSLNAYAKPHLKEPNNS